MSNYTHQTAPTQFVEAAGIRFACRRFANRPMQPTKLNSWRIRCSKYVRRRALYALSNQPRLFSKLLAIHLSQQPFTSLRVDELLRFGRSFLAPSNARQSVRGSVAPRNVAADASSSE